jgi:hypothetical protein
MLRTVGLTVFLLVGLPLCLLIGAVLGFHLLLILYLAFGIDFPTEISIMVGLMPVVVSLIGLGLAYNTIARPR